MGQGVTATALWPVLMGRRCVMATASCASRTERAAILRSAPQVCTFQTHLPCPGVVYLFCALVMISSLKGRFWSACYLPLGLPTFCPYICLQIQLNFPHFASLFRASFPYCFNLFAGLNHLHPWFTFCIVPWSFCLGISGLHTSAILFR